MLSRSLFGSAALLVMPLAFLAAQRLEYAPGTTRYRVLTSSTGTREQMGASVAVTFDSRQVLTVTLTRSHRDTLALALSVDSLTGQADGQPIPPVAGTGLRVLASLTPGGDVYRNSVKAASDSALPGIDVEDVARFLPPLRGAMRPGSAWSDTVAKPVMQLGMELKRVVVANYEIMGDTTYEGERAWRIARRTSTTVNGEGAAMGQRIVVEAKGKGTGAVYVSAHGGFLGGFSRDEIISTAHIGDTGTTVSESRTMDTRVERIR
jgi:hypothetical protein